LKGAAPRSDRNSEIADMGRRMYVFIHQ
jgi:hypothetical protein